MDYPIICQSSKGSADHKILWYLLHNIMADSLLGYCRINCFILKNSYLYLQHFDLRVTWKNLYQINNVIYRGIAKWLVLLGEVLSHAIGVTTLFIEILLNVLKNIVIFITLSGYSQEKAPSNKTPALIKTTNMGIWVVGTSSQLFLRGS